MRADELWLVRCARGDGVHAVAFEGTRDIASCVFEALREVLPHFGHRDHVVRLVRVPMAAQQPCRCVGCTGRTAQPGYCWECRQFDCERRDPSEQRAFHGAVTCE